MEGQSLPMSVASVTKSIANVIDLQFCYIKIIINLSEILNKPKSNLIYYNLLNSIVLPVGFVFRWGASTMLLRNFYQRLAKLPLSFWIVLSLPLILYLIGKMPGFIAGESFQGVDEQYRYFFRLLFR